MAMGTDSEADVREARLRNLVYGAENAMDELHGLIDDVRELVRHGTADHRAMSAVLRVAAEERVARQSEGAA